MKPKTKEIILKEYDPKWRDHFHYEQQQLTESFAMQNDDHSLIELIHVGSTSVQGLIAKPIIDIILVTQDIMKIEHAMISAGYRYKGEYNIPMRRMYGVKRDGYEVYLHAYEKGHPEIELNVAFRDYLRAHDDARNEYAKLKCDIVKRSGGDSALTSTGITNYNLEKNDFISNILRAAGFNGLCMRLCTQDIEWKKYEEISTTALSKDEKASPYSKHLVLYRGVDIIGAAQLICSKKPDNILLEFIEQIANHDGKKLGDARSHFLYQIERWCKTMGASCINISAEMVVASFYQHHGYTVIGTSNRRTHLVKMLEENAIYMRSKRVPMNEITLAK